MEVFPYNTVQADTPGVVKPNHAGVIFFLGFIGLLTCFPGGIAAWVLASYELKQIRQGKMSRHGESLIKVGRILGISGLVLSAALLVVSYKMAGSLFKGLPESFQSEPLAADKMKFVGEWKGDAGTLITIYANGTGDYRATGKSITGGRVIFTEDTLRIGLFGIYKTWGIEAAPHLSGDEWTMTLDNEAFRRKVEGLIVKASLEEPSSVACVVRIAVRRSRHPTSKAA